MSVQWSEWHAPDPSSPPRSPETFIFPRTASIDSLVGPADSGLDSDEISLLDFLSEERDPLRRRSHGHEADGVRPGQGDPRERRAHHLKVVEEQTRSTRASQKGGRQAIFSSRSSRRREEDAEHQKQVALQADAEKRETILHAMRSKKRASVAAARHHVDAAGKPLAATHDAEEGEAQQKKTDGAPAGETAALKKAAAATEKGKEVGKV
jgi:hypothetical protein